MPHPEIPADSSPVIPAGQNTTPYDRLMQLIEKRQAFEQMHFVPPYTTYSTDINYFDLNGDALLHHAARMGDVDKIDYCLQQGAKINLLDNFNNDNGLPAIVLAARAEHLSAVEYLYSRGASCHKLYLTDCPDPSMKAWFCTKLQAAFSEAYPLEIFAAEPPQATNSFFEMGERKRIDPSDEDSLSDVLYRAIELGNQDFVANFFELYVDFPEAQKMQCVLAAIKNDQQVLLRYLVEQERISLTPAQQYRTTPLQVAISSHHNEIAEYLITDCAVDPNMPAQYKRTPLMWALIANNVVMTERLLTLGVNMFGVDIKGKNILHFLADHGNHTLAEKIKQHLCPKGLKNLLAEKNIYGDMPEDAIKRTPSKDLLLAVWNVSRKSAAKETKYNIGQLRIGGRIFFYLQSNYRDKTFFAPDGHCAGLSFLYGLYDKDYYFDTLQQLVRWDGSDEMLDRFFPEHMPQAKYYKNLRELFEQWINDIFWFQSQGTLLDIPVLDAASQGLHYTVVRHPEQKPYQLIYESDFSKKTLAQIKTLLMCLSLLPAGMRYDFSFGKHSTTAIKSQSNDFAYYDPNTINETVDFYDIFEAFIDRHCIPLNQFADVLLCSFAVFVFAEQSTVKDFIPAALSIEACGDEDEQLESTVARALL